MAVDEEAGIYAMGQGCPSHGDDHMRECSMCGAEFCRICHPKTAVCPDCAESADDEDEDEDFEDAGEEVDDDEEEDEKGDKEEKEDLPRGGVLDDGDDRRY